MKPKRGRRREGWLKKKGGTMYAFIKWEGKRYIEAGDGPLVKDGQKKLDEMRAALKNGTYQKPRTRIALAREAEARAKAEKQAKELSTVAALADKWLEVRIRSGRNEKGFRVARARVQAYLKPALGEKAAAEVTADDLRKYRLWLEAYKNEHGRKLHTQTVFHVLGDVSSFFRWAVEAKHIAGSPVPRKLKPKQQETAPRALSEADALLVTAIPNPYGLACRLMLECGVRWGELVGLEAKHVQDGQLIVESPKTKKLRRIPIPAALLLELKRCIYGPLVPFGRETKDYLAFLKETRRLSGLKTFGAHALRHTFAYRWIWKGGSLSALQLMMGHHSISTTEIYAKPTDALVTRECERIWSEAATA